MVRDVLALRWERTELVHRLSFGPADVDTMTDDRVAQNLRALGVAPLPATVAEQRARLKDWPTPADLDALAVERIDGGVKPTVRVIERVPSRRPLGVGGAGGPAGSLPPRAGSRP